MNLKMNLKQDQKSAGAAAREEQEMGFPRMRSGGTPLRVPLCYHHPQLLAFAPEDAAHIPGGTPGGWGGGASCSHSIKGTGEFQNSLSLSVYSSSL